MLNKIYKIISLFSLLLFSLSFIKIENTPKKIIKDYINFNIIKKEEDSKIEKDDSIGKIIINKLDINKSLYPVDSPKNNIEENITILKESIFPDQENSIMFIAAHSGTSYISFFKDLDKLDIDDEIILEYNNKEYKYYVKNYWEEIKNGYINVNKEKENQLILTTCSPKKDNYQLIINCIQKES